MLEAFNTAAFAEMHLHVRQGAVLDAVVPLTARYADIATIMPNTKPPITTVAQAREYRRRIREAAEKVNPNFRPLMTLYLTDSLSPDTIREAFQPDDEGERTCYAAKLYPAGATTNSDDGITALEKAYAKFEVMEEVGMPLLIHGEMVKHNGGPEYAFWEREHLFLRHQLPSIRERYPRLKCVLEHLSTAEGVACVINDGSGSVAATLTAHHLTHDNTDVMRGSLSTDGHCLPIMKTPYDRQVLRQAAVMGHPRIFAGTDSAPHSAHSKYSSNCPGGAFTALGAPEAYAAVFREEGMLETPDDVARFERFTSLNGPAFYGIEPSKRTIRYVRNDGSFAIRENVPVTPEDGEPFTLVPFYHESLRFGLEFPYRLAE